MWDGNQLQTCAGERESSALVIFPWLVEGDQPARGVGPQCDLAVVRYRPWFCGEAFGEIPCDCTVYPVRNLWLLASDRYEVLGQMMADLDGVGDT